MALTVQRVDHLTLDQQERRMLEQRAASLQLRLEDGYSRIERALADGQDVTRWEELWQRLLEEYELISDRLAEDE